MRFAGGMKLLLNNTGKLFSTIHRNTAMIRTVEATVDNTGDVRLVKPLHISGVHRALVTILDEPPAETNEAAGLSEQALAKDWDRPEEDEAWSHIQ